MGRIHVETHIDAPVTAVWSAIEAIERHAEWMADATAIRFTTEQTRGVGTTFDCETKVGPFTLIDRMEVIDWQPPHSMGVRHLGVVTGTGRFTLTPAPDGGTTFGWTETLRFPGRLGGRVGERLGGQGILRWIWRRNLRSLKRLIESG